MTGHDKQRRQSSLSLSLLELFLGSLPISHLFLKTCIEPWSLLRVFLLVMGVDENSGNSSPQLQNMKWKYKKFMAYCDISFAATLDERSENFVFISFVHSSSLCDLSSMSCSPKPHLKNDKLFTASGYQETRSYFWVFSICSMFSKMLVLY